MTETETTLAMLVVQMRNAKEHRIEAKEQRGEILTLLRELNGNVRQNKTALAVQNEWTKGHEKDVHGSLKEDISALKRHNLTVSGLISIVSSSLSGAIAWILSR